MFSTILTNFHLEKILWILKVKLIYIMLVTILGAIAGWFYVEYTNTSTYAAQISFYVYSNPDYITDPTVNITSSEISTARYLVSSYMQILKSNTFLTKVKEETGINVPVDYLRRCISASAVDNTAAFFVNVFSDDPVSAMNIANAIGNLAPDEIIRIVKSGGIEVLDKAELPTVPYQSKSMKKYIAIGACAGMALSALCFLLKGLLDTSIRKKYEIEDMFTIPILGNVPQLPPATRKKPVNKILNSDSSFQWKEAYSNIRANLLFTAHGEKCPVYAITSADEGEGKTMNTINLAISYSQIGKNVLIIDADMRKSSISSKLGIARSKGLSEYLAGLAELPKIIECYENLSVISAGYMPPNPAELLANDRWEELLIGCKKIYDAIFIEIPPVGVVSDGLLLAKEVTAYILIVREKVTKFDREKMIVRQLEPLGANICGFIYNGMSVKFHDNKYKNHENEYSTETRTD